MKPAAENGFHAFRTKEIQVPDSWPRNASDLSPSKLPHCRANYGPHPSQPPFAIQASAASVRSPVQRSVATSCQCASGLLWSTATARRSTDSASS